MPYKANFHFHTSDDPQDVITHTAREGIDRAAELGFHILAITCHQILTYRPEDAVYAQERGVLLIPGVERSIEGRHVVLLNVDHSVESTSTFAGLAEYRRAHPGAFVLAPHPYFDAGFSLGRKVEEHLDLFDALELSWFHSPFLDRNRKTEALARRRGIPYLATSDTHLLHHLDDSYALVDAPELSMEAVFSALRGHRCTNVSKDQRFWKTMVFEVGVREIQNRLRRLLQ